MSHSEKKPDPLPDESATLDEVADFWGTHDTTDYAHAFTDADVTFDIRRRRYEVEVEEDTFELLTKRAASLSKPVQEIIDAALRKELVGPS